MMTSTDEFSNTVAGELLRIGAISLSPSKPYTWASGLRSPIYCDNRITLGHPIVRSLIADGFVHIIETQGLACDVVGGIATAGIPHAAWLADRLEKPMIYVRGEAKSHGRQRQIEGELADGNHVVLIEDLVSTGRSSLAVVEPVQAAGCTISGILAIFTYGLKQSRDAFQAAAIPLFTLTDFPSLIAAARERDLISKADLASLQAWYQDPVAWSESHGN